jgi:peroxiredoxin
MRSFSGVLISIFLLAAPPAVVGQATASSIDKELRGLRGVPDSQRPAVTIHLAKEIRTLPAGVQKLSMADGLSQLAEAGDSGREAMQMAADTLAQALTEVPLSGPDEAPAMPYFDLARLVRYEGIRTDFTGPQLAKANAILAASDADVEKADFTLNDMKGKKYTFSQLRGKVVLVNFWATWCPPCPKELSDLDAVYMRLQLQELIVLSITPDAPSDLNRFFSRGGVHLPVLLDTDGKVLEEFHVDGLPMTYVFNRKGRLAAKSINVRNQHQFLLMLAKAGLHP